jgi:hypothetical protein
MPFFAVFTEKCPFFMVFHPFLSAETAFEAT